MSDKPYLNEKPHEPTLYPNLEQPDTRRDASPPHAAAEPEKPVDNEWEQHVHQSDDVDSDGLIRSLRLLRSEASVRALEFEEREKITQAADELTKHRRASAETEPVAWIWHGMDGRGTKTLRWRKTNQWEYAPEGETPLYASPSAQPIARERVYWVLERFENGKSQGYWDGGNSRSFTFDINKAIQFCRREDVFWVTRGWHWTDCEPVQHMDCAGPDLTGGANG